MSTIRGLLLWLLLAMPVITFGQSGWVYRGNFNFGANLTLVYGKGQNFPGIKMYAGFIANAVYKNNFILNYGPTLCIYSHTLGANLNPLVGDVQIDLINSFGVGGGSDPDTFYKFFRTMGNGMYYNAMLNQEYAGMMTTNFILNNHKRHQVNCALTGTTPLVTLTYYNDGAWPFPLNSFSDNFDRWWTGGGALYVHNRKGYNTLELCFDQFTGTKPLLYEVANKLGIDVSNYNLNTEDTNRDIPPDFNTSVYTVRFYPSRGFGIEAGLLGALRTKEGKYYGIQDIIHTIGRYPIHPNYDVTRFFIGGTYNNLRNVKL
jgi:hypothetical protein